MWKVLQAIALFATAGLILAGDFLATFGIEGDSPVVAAAGLGIATMLMYRSTISILVMVLFVILIRLPESTLATYDLDREMLLAFAVALLFLPWIQRAAQK